jgi:hypothetical protein
MAERETLWGWDLDESPADGIEGDASNGHHEPVTEPIPVVDSGPGVPEQTEAEPAGHPAEIGRAFTYAGPFIDRTPGSPISSLTFKAPTPAWYRTRKGLVAILVVLAAAVMLAIVPLVVRDSAPGTDESPGVTPSAPAPSPPPAMTSAVPTLSSPPAPPPPPPPPPVPEDSPPAVTRQYPAPRYDPPIEQTKPEIGVTRAPMSVAPEQRTPPSTAVPDGKPRRGFF